MSYWLNTEALVLAEQIVNALRMKPCEMYIDDDAMLIGPTNDFAFGVFVFGPDAELAKKIADAIGKNGGPIGAGFMARDPTASAMHVGFQNPSAHEATILVGIKPDWNTRELIKITPPTKAISP